MSNNKTPVLTPQLARLAANLLRLAASDFSNHGCNDLDLTKIPGFETREARTALDLAYHAWNGDPKEHDPDGDHRYGFDSALMAFAADILDKTAGKPFKKGETERKTIEVQNATTAAQDAGLTASSAVREYQDAKTRAEARVGALRRELEKLERLIGTAEDETGDVIEAAHAALDLIVARRDTADGPPLSLSARAATAVRIAQEAIAARDAAIALFRNPDGTVGEHAESICRIADILRGKPITVEHRCSDPAKCMLCMAVAETEPAPTAERDDKPAHDTRA